MKKLIAFALATMLASPVFAQDATPGDPQMLPGESDPAPAQMQPVTVSEDSSPRSLQTVDAQVEEDSNLDLANEALIPEEADSTATDAESNSVETWNGVDDTGRFLLIMGTADGFSAAGSGAPCFPGKDNSALDTALKSAGFGDKDPAALTPALANLSAPAEQCVTVAKRGYTTDLLKSMPDEHLAVYLTGAVRGYAHVKACPEANFTYAAATATAAVFTAEVGAAPADVLGAAFEEGCLGIQDVE